ELARYEAAIATLSAAVARGRLDENARLDLAIARLGAGQLEAARADYQELLKTTGQSRNALFGLGGVAWRKHDTNAAIEFYQQYLATGGSGSLQYLVASKRLKQLQGQPPKRARDEN